MYEEKTKIETVGNQEAHENHEAPRSVEESAKEIGEQMIRQSENEVANFQQESESEFARLETRAEKDSFVIDGEDKKELGEINIESNSAKDELVAVISAEQLPNMTPPLPVEYLQAYAGNMPPPLPSMPPPLPVEYLQKISRETPPPIPNMPPPLPEEYKKLYAEDALDSLEEQASEKQEKEPKHGSLEYYLQKSKISDKTEALNKLMTYAGVSSEEALTEKFQEENDNEFTMADMEMFTPDILRLETVNPSVRLLKRIRGVGDALGYTFANTPGYEMHVKDIISNLKSGGKTEDATEVERIFEEDMVNFENEKDKSEFQKIDENLTSLFKDEENFKKYIEKQKNLPPDAIVYLYHGLNGGGYDSVLKILNGASKGIEQHSGPTVSLTPSGGFWKNVGFRYALRRDQIEFPGEKNPNAIVSMCDGADGLPDTGVIINESGSLPLDQFEAEIMRSGFTLPDSDMEKKVVEKLNELSLRRNAEKVIE